MNTMGPVLGIIYFASDPLRSYFNEPQKNEIYFLKKNRWEPQKNEMYFLTNSLTRNDCSPESNVPRSNLISKNI